jgi:hypothetical protein
VRAAIQRNDSHVVHHFDQNHHIFRSLDNLIIAVVRRRNEGWLGGPQQTTLGQRPVPSAVRRMFLGIGIRGEKPSACLQRVGGQVPVGGIDDQRSSNDAVDPRQRRPPIEEKFVVSTDEIHFGGTVVTIAAAILLHRLLELSGFLFRKNPGEAHIVSAVIEVTPLGQFSPEPPPAGDSCLMTIFGASGDLTRRKLIPGLYNLACEGCMNPEFEVLGVGANSDDYRRVSLQAARNHFQSGRYARLQRQTAGANSRSACTTSPATSTTISFMPACERKSRKCRAADPAPIGCSTFPLRPPWRVRSWKAWRALD